MRYLETHSTDPAYNLAFEEWVLTHLIGEEYLILWQNDRTVVIGQNQNTPEEINADFVKEHGIRVVRRTTGGGAVYHDLGNLNYSFITDYDREAGTDMSRFTDLVVSTLKELGLHATASGRNDILVNGKKVSGTAQRIVKVHKGAGADDGAGGKTAAAAGDAAGGEDKKDEPGTVERILYHGTLLFRSDPDMISGALHADPLKFASKSTKSVRSRVGNIADSLPEGMELAEFWNKLRGALLSENKEAGKIPAAGSGKASADSIATGKESNKENSKENSKENNKENSKGKSSVTAAEIDFEAVEKLKKEKYDTWEWNYGRSPAMGFTSKKRFPGGTLEVHLSIEKGCITDASLYGDFLSLKPASDLAGRLIGVRYAEEEVRRALTLPDLQEHLGSITEEELICTLFDA